MRNVYSPKQKFELVKRIAQIPKTDLLRQDIVTKAKRFQERMAVTGNRVTFRTAFEVVIMMCLYLENAPTAMEEAQQKAKSQEESIILVKAKLIQKKTLLEG